MLNKLDWQALACLWSQFILYTHLWVLLSSMFLFTFCDWSWCSFISLDHVLMCIHIYEMKWRHEDYIYMDYVRIALINGDSRFCFYFSSFAWRPIDTCYVVLLLQSASFFELFGENFLPSSNIHPDEWAHTHYNIGFIIKMW